MHPRRHHEYVGRWAGSDDCAVESPWRKVADLAIGGLTEIGFAAPRLMLVVSHQGRAVLDCATGARIARDRARNRRLV